jgi:predicted nucleic acid-binding protein
MKVIIAGSRDITDYQFVKEAIEAAIETSGFVITEVIFGCAKGVDTLGEKWARENNIPIAHFPADWKQYGKRAGHLRNSQMADYGEALIAARIDETPGTTNMIEIAEKKGLKIYKEFYPF